MQFQVPQNIDLEDKIVGPLTLTQFLYILGGSLIDYIMYETFGANYFGLFLLIGIPVALLTLGLAFFKVQEQPLSRFIVVGLIYLTKPKLRLWRRQTNFQPVLTEPPKKKVEPVAVSRHHLDKSELDQLAYNLDTFQSATPQVEKKKIGAVTAAFEQLLKEQPKAQAAPANMTAVKK